MKSIIRHGNSVPEASDLETFQLGWNDKDKELYIKDSEGDLYLLNDMSDLCIKDGVTKNTDFDLTSAASTALLENDETTLVALSYTASTKTARLVTGQDFTSTIKFWVSGTKISSDGTVEQYGYVDSFTPSNTSNYVEILTLDSDSGHVDIKIMIEGYSMFVISLDWDTEKAYMSIERLYEDEETSEITLN